MRLEDGWYDHVISSEAMRGVAGSLRERLGVGCEEEAQGRRWTKRGKEDRSMKNVIARKPNDRVIPYWIAQLYIIFGHTVRVRASAAAALAALVKTGEASKRKRTAKVISISHIAVPFETYPNF